MSEKKKQQKTREFYYETLVFFFNDSNFTINLSYNVRMMVSESRRSVHYMYDSNNYKTIGGNIGI